MVQDRGGAEFQTAGNLLYVEDLKRGTNKDMGPKDIFEMGSNLVSNFAKLPQEEVSRDAELRFNWIGYLFRPIKNLNLFHLMNQVNAKVNDNCI